MADVTHSSQTIADGIHGSLALGPWGNEVARTAINASLVATDLYKEGIQTDTIPPTRWQVTQITPSVVWTQVATGAHLTLGTGHDNAARGDAPAAAVAAIPTASADAAGLMSVAQASSLAALAAIGDATVSAHGYMTDTQVTALAAAATQAWVTGQIAGLGAPDRVLGPYALAGNASLTELVAIPVPVDDGESLKLVVEVKGYERASFGTQSNALFFGEVLRSGSSLSWIGGSAPTPVDADAILAGWAISIDVSGLNLSVSGQPGSNNTNWPVSIWWNATPQAYTSTAGLAPGTLTAFTATPTTPAVVLAGSTGNTIALAGTLTDWTSGTPGSPTFTFSSGSATQVISSATAATLTFDAPAGAATITVTDPQNDVTATFPVRAVATSYALTAPTPASGTVGEASGNFTVALSAGEALATNVVVTPSDGGQGGTFTPSTVTLHAYEVADSATFTYTPAIEGALTISTTNDGGLTDPAGVTYTSNAADTAWTTFVGLTGCRVATRGANATFAAGALTGITDDVGGHDGSVIDNDTPAVPPTETTQNGLVAVQTQDDSGAATGGISFALGAGLGAVGTVRTFVWIGNVTPPPAFARPLLAISNSIGLLQYRVSGTPAVGNWRISGQYGSAVDLTADPGSGMVCMVLHCRPGSDDGAGGGSLYQNNTLVDGNANLPCHASAVTTPDVLNACCNATGDAALTSKFCAMGVFDTSGTAGEITAALTAIRSAAWAVAQQYGAT